MKLRATAPALATLAALTAASLGAQEGTGLQPSSAKTTPVEVVEETKSSTVADWEDGSLSVDSPVGEFSLGGYATFIHKTIDRYNGGGSENFFDAIRIVPQFEWQIVDWLDFNMELELEGGGADVSFLSGNEILIEFAETNATLIDEFNIQAGILLIPFGRYNLNHDDLNWDLADRPYVARRVTPTAFGQPGFGIYGTFNQLEALSISYELDVTQGFDDEFSSNGGARPARQSFRADNNGNKAIWARLGLTPSFATAGIEALAADFGLSFTYQEIGPDNSQSLRGVSVDGAVSITASERVGIGITGEWSRLWINRDSAIDRPNGLWGFFVDLELKIDPFPAEWRGTHLGRNPYIGLIVRFEQNDLNDDHVGAAARDDRIGTTVGLAFRPLSKLVVRIEFKHQQSQGTDAGDETRLVTGVTVGF